MGSCSIPPKGEFRVEYHENGIALFGSPTVSTLAALVNQWDEEANGELEIYPDLAEKMGAVIVFSTDEKAQNWKALDTTPKTNHSELDLAYKKIDGLQKNLKTVRRMFDQAIAQRDELQKELDAAMAQINAIVSHLSKTQ